MRVSLVCIAKNEENYIDEWIKYHLKIGFDNIFIYENNWRFNNSECYNNKILKIPFDGVAMQNNAYNHFIDNNSNNFDWCMFLDVDEFLVLKKHSDIKNFINDYKEYDAIGINWVAFGDNGLNLPDKGVLKRFTKRQIGINLHVKSIIKMNPTTRMLCAHNPNIEWIDTNKKIHTGPFNQEGDDSIAQINHYFCKTKPEFLQKVLKGRADTGAFRDLNEFDHLNCNEIDEYIACNFLYV